MQVSIIIPLYNKAQTIQRALASVFRQTLQDFEVIIIDDGSTDGSAEQVAACADPRVTLIRQENAGPSAARDRGMRLAQGEYLALLDGDDEWLPDHLARAVRLLDDFPQAAIGGMGLAFWRETPPYPPVPINGIGPEGWRGILPDFFAASMQYPPLSGSSTIIRRRAFTELDPRPAASIQGEDQHLWAQFAVHYPVAYDSAITAIYHHQTTGNTSTTVTYYEELPYVTYLRELLQSGVLRQLPVNEASVRAFIWKGEAIIIRPILKHGGNRDLACELLRRYVPNTPGDYCQWLRYWVELHLPERWVRGVKGMLGGK